MNRKDSESAAIDAIRALLQARGGLVYGERVTQLEHALQCAMFAQRDGAPAALVVAAMLHDVGHMVHRDPASAFHASEDDLHERLGAKYLARWFGPDVTEPVALHVPAKRFLCAREPDYLSRLTPVSRRTLEMQGGPMTPREAETFAELPFAPQAVRVRRWDDEGKHPGLETPPLEQFLEIARDCLVTT